MFDPTLENLKSTILSTVHTVPAFVFAVEAPSRNSVLITIILPILFFTVSKTVDVFLQIYFRRQEAARLERERQEKLAAKNNFSEDNK